MSRLLHATIGSVELPGANFARELGDHHAVLDGASQDLIISPPDGDYEPGSGPQTQFMGPIGRWPDHTPAYDTPATHHIDDISDLNGMVGSTSGGDVIEVAGVYNGSTTVNVSNSPGGTGNVLVRPPIGSRGMNLSSDGDVRIGPDGPSSSAIQVERITLAGFHQQRPVAFNQAQDCALAWWTQAEPQSGSRVDIRGCVRVQLWEVVRRDKDAVSEASATVVFRNSGHRVCTDTLLIGCWVNGGESIKDNLQTLAANSPGNEGSNLDGMVWESCVLKTGRDKVFQCNPSVAGMQVRNCWLHGPLTADEDNGGTYDWSLSTGNPSITAERTSNWRLVADTGNLFTDLIVLGGLSDNDSDEAAATLQHSILRSTPSGDWMVDGGGNTVDSNIWESEAGQGSDPTFYPPPDAPSEPELDSIWST